jgi:hypothetical protein
MKIANNFPANTMPNKRNIKEEIALAFFLYDDATF